MVAGRRQTRARWVETLLRVLVLALLLPLATSGALPVWAQLAGVEGPHVCHCSIEKHDCVCAKCSPDREDLFFTTESIAGRCGDDEVAFGGKAICAVLPARMDLSPIAVRVSVMDRTVSPRPMTAAPPPTPPPRSSSSRV